MTQSERSVLESMGRFLSELIVEAWGEFAAKRGIRNPAPRFSGIIPLTDPSLLPFLDLPGVFLVLGPLPEISLLHLGASQNSIGEALWIRIAPDLGQGYSWRWEEGSSAPPAYVACVALEGGLDFIPPLHTLLARRMGPGTMMNRASTSR